MAQPSHENLPPVSGLGDHHLVGKTFGGCTLQAEIGRGGMGTVFVAWQESLRRQVAVKVLHAGLEPSGSAVARFEREAQAAAQLNHPSIVPIFGQGVENGIHYYIMEFVQGKNLRRVLDEERGIEDSDARRTGTIDDETVIIPRGHDSPTEIGISGAVLAAPPIASTAPETARAGTLSRSGSGVRVRRFDMVAERLAEVADALEHAHNQGVIHRDIKPHNLVLSDSGRMCVTDFGLARLMAEPGVTVTGEFVGSPLYMSPEQVSPSGAKPDHRTDIYSLGATLYEWLTLTPLHQGETREQVISRILSHEPATPRSIDPSIPVDLETICLKAVEKDPNRRYSSAGALRDDLLTFLNRGQIRARRDGFIARTFKHVGRHRMGTTAGLAAVVAIGLGLAVFVQRQRHQEKQHEFTEIQSQMAAVKDEKDELARERDQLRTMLEAGISLGKQLGAPELLSGRLPTSGGPAIEIPDAERELARRIVPALISDYIQYTNRSLDRADRPLGRAGYFDAILDGDRDRAWMLLRPTIESNPEDYAARHLRAVLACERERFPLMEVDAEQMVRLKPNAWHSYALRGLARLFMRKPAEAESDLFRALVVRPHDSWLLTGRALAYGAQGRFDEARDDLRLALQEDSQEVATLFARADMAMKQKDFANAIVDLSEVLIHDPENWRAYGLRGRSFEATRDWVNAYRDYERAYAHSGALSVEYLIKAIAMQARLGGTNPKFPAAEAETEAKESLAPDLESTDNELGKERPEIPSFIPSAGLN